MNIYDEAIEKLKSVMAKFIIPSVEDSDYGCLYDRCHFYNSLDEEEDKWLRNVYKALGRAKKVEELLDLYRLQHEFKERYNTSVRLLDQQECLDNIREIAEEIYLKEEELEEMK